jgi:hypothetical protein
VRIRERAKNSSSVDGSFGDVNGFFDFETLGISKSVLFCGRSEADPSDKSRHLHGYVL